MTATTLIKNAWLWPSADSEPVEGGSVWVQNGRLARVGRFDDEPADEVIDAGGALVMPGLVQTHLHMCQTLLRGTAEDMPLLLWLRKHIWPMEAAHDPASLRASALLSCAELIRSGTTTFMSMETVRHTDEIFKVVDASGLMGVVCHCFMDESSGYEPLAVNTDEALTYAEDLLNEWKSHERVRLGIAPRFALSCTAQNMRRCCDYARERGLILHTHASEQIPEVDLVWKQTGMRNIQYLDSVGLTGPDVGLAHCVHTQEKERDILVETDTKILHCPSANLKLGSGVAPVPEYLGRGLTVSIGADGTPCNNRLDGFMEMRTAGLMQKPRLGPDALPAREVVKMATEHGAKTLAWEKELGTLEEGKWANLIMVDQDSLHVVPSTDPAANVVYANLSSDVRLTMCKGRVLYRDGEFKTLDEEKVRAEAREQREKLMART